MLGAQARHLLDTVAVVRHLSGEGRIGRSAARILDSIETGSDLLLISAVSLMEILYLSEKERIPIDLGETLDKIEASESYAVVDLNAQILKVAEILDYRELHDRLILSTAKWLGVAILSSDRRRRGAGGRMAAVPVTNAQFAVFDPKYEPSAWKGVRKEELPYHPAVICLRWHLLRWRHLFEV